MPQQTRAEADALQEQIKLAELRATHIDAAKLSVQKAVNFLAQAFEKLNTGTASLDDIIVLNAAASQCVQAGARVAQALRTHEVQVLVPPSEQSSGESRIVVDG